MYTCDRCGQETQERGLYKQEDGSWQTLCYECCGYTDSVYMQSHDRITLYLTMDITKRTAYVSNWPGTLRIDLKHYPRKGKHNFAHVRYDVWFHHAGKAWHGVQYGDNTQLVHCKVIKGD